MIELRPFDLSSMSFSECPFNLKQDEIAMSVAFINLTAMWRSSE